MLSAYYSTFTSPVHLLIFVTIKIALSNMHMYKHACIGICMYAYMYIYYYILLLPWYNGNRNAHFSSLMIDNWQIAEWRFLKKKRKRKIGMDIQGDEFLLWLFARKSTNSYYV